MLRSSAQGVDPTVCRVLDVAGKMLRSSAQGVDPPVCRVLDVAGKMLRSSAQGVDPPVCRVLDVAATHARDSSCLFRRAICPLEGGGPDRLASGLQYDESLKKTALINK